MLRRWITFKDAVGTRHEHSRFFFPFLFCTAKKERQKSCYPEFLLGHAIGLYPPVSCAPWGHATVEPGLSSTSNGTTRGSLGAPWARPGPNFAMLTDGTSQIWRSDRPEQAPAAAHIPDASLRSLPAMTALSRPSRPWFSTTTSAHRPRGSNVGTMSNDRIRNCGTTVTLYGPSVCIC